MSTCDVSLGEWDGDSAEFYVETTVKARRKHKCYECNEVINAGERYQRVSGKWDGTIEVYRFCLPCWEITGEFSESGRTFGIAWAVFRDEWAGGATLQACLNRVSSVAAKVKLQEQWLKAKGLL